LLKGSFFIPTYQQGENGNYSLEMKPGNLNQLHGRLGFIDNIDRYNTELLSAESQKKSKETVYRRFLFYKEFYVASKPVLICEGWTDYVYIENALRQLAPNYPSLVSLDSNGKATFGFRRFKNTRSHTAEIIGIKGGVGDLKNFIPLFKSEFEHFSAPGMKEPVILLVDNDKAGKEVLGVVCNMQKKSKRTKTKIDKDESYIHVHRNLYIISTPLQEGQLESQIEDLFNAATLGIEIEGKSFNRSDEKATETTYSKAVFARKVVEERASSINFEGFIPLLDRIEKVIESHYAQRKESSPTPTQTIVSQ
jgi:RNA-directed DNA polymerase